MAPHVPVRQQPENFLQKTFNTISLQRDEQLWLSTDDHLTESRLKLLAEFPETQFNSQFKLDCVSNAKNGKLSSALREKGNLSYAQGDCESALRLYNQVLLQFFAHPNFLANHANFWKLFFNRASNLLLPKINLSYHSKCTLVSSIDS